MPDRTRSHCQRLSRCAGAEVCRWITSLAGGSARWGANEVVARGPRYKLPPPPQTACKLVRNSVRVSQNSNDRSLPVRHQRKMISVVRAYEEDVLDRGWAPQ